MAEGRAFPDPPDTPGRIPGLIAARDAKPAGTRCPDTDIRQLVSRNKALRREVQALRVRSWRDEERIAALETELAQTRRARDSANRRNRRLADQMATPWSQWWFRLTGRLGARPRSNWTELEGRPILAGAGPFFRRGFLLGNAAEIAGTTVRRIKRAPSGMLVFGPYVTLAAGTYAATLDARLYRRLPISASFKLEIVCDESRQIVGSRWCRLHSLADWRSFELIFTVWEGEDYPDFELRVWARKGTPLAIGRIDLYQLTGPQLTGPQLTGKPSPAIAGPPDATDGAASP